MTAFEDRAKAFENKFAHDAEMQFRAEVRRNKLLGLWAAGLKGLEGAEAEDFARGVVQSDFEEAGSDDVVRKLLASLDGRVDAEQIRAKMTELLPVAKAQLFTEV